MSGHRGMLYTLPSGEALTQEDRRRVALRVIDGRTTAEGVASSLGVNERTVRRWVVDAMEQPREPPSAARAPIATQDRRKELASQSLKEGNIVRYVGRERRDLIRQQTDKIRYRYGRSTGLAGGFQHVQQEILLCAGRVLSVELDFESFCLGFADKTCNIFTHFGRFYMADILHHTGGERNLDPKHGMSGRGKSGNSVADSLFIESW